MRPSVLLFDEPTAHLDPRGRREFITLIRSLPGTKLIATHDLEVVLLGGAIRVDPRGADLGVHLHHSLGFGDPVGDDQQSGGEVLVPKVSST